MVIEWKKPEKERQKTGGRFVRIFYWERRYVHERSLPSNCKGAHLYPADWPPQPHFIHDFVLHVAVLLLQPNGENHPGQSQSCQSAVPVPASISRTTPTERRGPQEMVLRPIEQLR